ncbi:nucleoside hydrolase, partial [Coniophora puteana RWD-64-598 SS2]
VLVDTDPGVDDVLAILLALASPEIEILAILVTYGTCCQPKLQARSLNIYKLYKAIARHLEVHPEDSSRFPNFGPAVKPFLALGPKGPLKEDTHYAEYFHGPDGLSNITERHPELDIDVNDPSFEQNFRITDRSTVDITLDLLREYPDRTITYIALGPLTQLAQIVQTNGQEFGDRIGKVVCMGGALDVPGNTTPIAEFNFYADPYAVKELLVASPASVGLPLDRFLLLPLDITSRHNLSFPYYKEKVDPQFSDTREPSRPEGKDPLTHFTSSFFERTREVMIGFGKDAMELHDIVAVWCAVECQPGDVAQVAGRPLLKSGWGMTERHFDIERTGELTRGMLIVDRRADAISAPQPGLNRSESEAPIPITTSNPYPIEKQTEEHAPVTAMHTSTQNGPPETTHRRGVLCIHETPGQDALVSLLLRRVWGVEG